MSNQNSVTFQRKRRWPLYLAIAGGGAVVLYFTLTSGAFIRGVVLPRVSSAIGSEVSAGDVSLSPFSSLVLRDVRLVPKGQPPLLEAREVRAKYSLIDIIRGTIRVEEVTLESPTLNVIQKADGSGNLASLLDGLPKSAPDPAPSAPPKLAVKNVSLRNGRVRFEQAGPDGARTFAEIANLNVGVDQVVNGQASKISVNADAAGEVSGRPQSGKFGGKVGGMIDVVLDEAVLPTQAKGGVKLDITQATGAFQNVGGLGVSLDVDLVKDDLRDLAIRLSQRGEELGRIGLKGQVDLAKSDMRLSYEIKGLNRRILSVVGAASGVDLGDTRIGAAGRLSVLKGGAELSSSGKLQVDQLSVGLGGPRTPVLDLTTDYSVSVNQADKKLQLDRLDIQGSQAGREVLKGGFDRPMNLSWEKGAQALRDSTFSMRVGVLDLAQWRAVLPTNAPTGQVGVDLKLTAEQAGSLLRFALDVNADQLSAAVGAGALKGASGKVKLSGNLSDFTKLVCETLQVDLRQGKDQLLLLNGSVDWNLTQSQGGAQLSVEGRIPAVLALNPVAGVALTDGTLKASLSGTYRETGSTADINVGLANLTGTVGEAQLRDYQVNVGLAANLKGLSLDLQRLSLAAQSGFAAGGSFMARGKFDLAQGAGSASNVMTLRSGTLEFNAVGVNESALGPFLKPALAPNQLQSVQVDLQGNLLLDGMSSQSTKTQLRISNLRVEDPDRRLAGQALAVGLDLDAAVRGQAIDLRQVVIDLGATANATNRLELSGKVDLGTNAPAPTQLAIRSSGLDLTRYYDLLAGTTNAAPVKSAPAPDVAKGRPEVEPPAVMLPLRDATLRLDIAKIVLRKILVEGLKGEARVKDNVIGLEGFGFSMNGAPVKAQARVNVGVPGYEYAMGFDADRLQVAPVLDSFVPVMDGASQGEMRVQADIKGAGVTGASFKRNLAGFATVEGTNVQIRIPNRGIPLPRLLVKFVPFLPDEINPHTWLAAVGRGAVLADPIRDVQVHALMGQGGMVLTNTHVANSMFRVEAQGGVSFMDVLDDSRLEIPVLLALANPGKPLPAVRTIGRQTGTMGKNTFNIDKLGIAGVLAGVELPGVGNLGESAARIGQAVGEKANELTKGTLRQATDAIGAVVPGTVKNTNGVLGAVNGLLNPVVGGNRTNAAGTNAPASTNAPAKQGGILDALPFGKGRK